MSENFKSTYEKSIKKDNTTYVNTHIPGGSFGTQWDDDKYNWNDDGFSLTGNPNSSLDIIDFGKSDSAVESLAVSDKNLKFGEDHISFNPIFTIKMPKENTNPNGFWKYEENKTLKAVEDYIASTYHSHYTSDQSKTQTLDLIESIGDSEAFTRSNAIKYLSRFGKKNGKSKMDILKAIHYCILLYHFAGLHKNTTNTYNY